MKTPALTPDELSLVAGVFRRHPEVASAKIFGSRAKGTHTPRSDVDLAVWGAVDAIRAEAIAAELEELPLPYHFDVQPFDSIKLGSLREHIERVGIAVYPEPVTADNFPQSRTLS
jgi:predicted nucleotidyltransferase